MKISMLENLARRCGIVESYVDARGQRRATRPQTRAALLAAMGFDGSSEDGARRAVETLIRREWTRILPPVWVHRTCGPPAVELLLPRRIEQIDWRVTLEDGRRLTGRAIVRDLDVLAKARVDGVGYVRVKLRLDGEFPHGYRTPCMLATVQLDDITDETEPVNVPTTSEERGNWRRRASLTLEQIAASSRLAKVSEIFAAERRNRAAVPFPGKPLKLTHHRIVVGAP